MFLFLLVFSDSLCWWLIVLGFWYLRCLPLILTVAYNAWVGFVDDFGPFKDFNKSLSSPFLKCYMTHVAFLMAKNCSLGQVGLWKQVMFGRIRWLKYASVSVRCVCCVRLWGNDKGDGGWEICALVIHYLMFTLSPLSPITTGLVFPLLLSEPELWTRSYDV